MGSYSSCPAVFATTGGPLSCVASLAPIAVISSASSSKTTKLNGGAIAIIVVTSVVLTIVLLTIWKWKGDKGQQHKPTTNFNSVDLLLELSPTTIANLLIVEASTPPSSNTSVDRSEERRVGKEC